jgi:hypothetical protein
MTLRSPAPIAIHNDSHVAYTMMRDSRLRLNNGLRLRFFFSLQRGEKPL